MPSVRVRSSSCLPPRRNAASGFTSVSTPTPHTTTTTTTSRATPTEEAADWIATHLDHGPISSRSQIGRSDWASTYRYTTTSKKDFFVKCAASAAPTSLLAGEVASLSALRAAAPDSLALPMIYTDTNMNNPTLTSSSSSSSPATFLVAEYLSLGGGSPDQRALGIALAQLHAAPVGNKYGFHVDNTIGGTPQPNPWCDDWVEFYRTHRLTHLLELIQDTSLTKAAQPVLDGLEVLFQDVVGTEDFRPATLHGDLWSGNIGRLEDGRPTIFDPATYFGHAEAEFGMSWCAGFTSAFYEGYFEVRPKALLFEERRELYTLYHYLNHYYMFGGGYKGGSLQMLASLTEKIKRLR